MDKSNALLKNQAWLFSGVITLSYLVILAQSSPQPVQKLPSQGTLWIQFPHRSAQYCGIAQGEWIDGNINTSNFELNYFIGNPLVCGIIEKFPVSYIENGTAPNWIKNYTTTSSTTSTTTIPLQIQTMNISNYHICPKGLSKKKWVVFGAKFNRMFLGETEKE